MSQDVTGHVTLGSTWALVPQLGPCSPTKNRAGRHNGENWQHYAWHWTQSLSGRLSDIPTCVFAHQSEVAINTSGGAPKADGLRFSGPMCTAPNSADL